MKKPKRIPSNLFPSRVGSFVGVPYKPLVEVSPGVVINRDEVLGCFAGEAVKKGTETVTPALIVIFKGPQVEVPFFCPNPAEAAAKLCL